MKYCKHSVPYLSFGLQVGNNETGILKYRESSLYQITMPGSLQLFLCLFLSWLLQAEPSITTGARKFLSAIRYVIYDCGFIGHLV